MSDETIFPRDNFDKTGWTINFAYLQKIRHELEIYEDCPDLEGIENVLLSKVVSAEIEKLQFKLSLALSVADKALRQWDAHMSQHEYSEDPSNPESKLYITLKAQVEKMKEKMNENS